MGVILQNLRLTLKLGGSIQTKFLDFFSEYH